MKNLLILSLICLFSACNKSGNTNPCSCAVKTEAVLKVGDAPNTSDSGLVHQLILADGSEGKILNPQDFGIRWESGNIAFCYDYTTKSNPPGYHLTCLEMVKEKTNCNPCSNRSLVTIENHTGFDGCGWLLKLENNEILEPINLNQYNINLVDGTLAYVTYENAEGMASICMMGKMVKICSLEIVKSNK